MRFLLLFLAACTPLAPPPRVLWHGCHEWRQETCYLLPETQLTFWVEGLTLEDKIQLRQDGKRALIPPPVAVAGGLRLHLLAEPGKVTLELTGRHPWVLRVAQAEPSLALAEIVQLRRLGRLAEAEAALAQLSPLTPGWAAQRARNALAAGKIDEAITHFQAAIAQDIAEDKTLALLRDRTALAYTYINHRYPVALARAELDALAPLAATVPEVDADLAYFETLLATEYKNPRDGIIHARKLLALAEKLDLTDAHWDGLQMLTGLLAFVGRWDEVHETLQKLSQEVPKSWSDCQKADLDSNLGWYGLLGYRQAPAIFPELPRAPLTRAAATYRAACPRPLAQLNAELNLAWLELFAGDLSAAQTHLDTAQHLAAQPDTRARLHLVHLSAALALAQNKLKPAEDAFRKLILLATSAQALATLWQGQVGLGQALEAQNKPTEAILAYAAGEATLTRLAAQVPLGEGKDGLLFERSLGADRWVALLALLGRWQEAAQVIRQHRLGTLAWAQALIALRQKSPDAQQKERVYQLSQARAALDETAQKSWTLPQSAQEAAREALRQKEREAREALDKLFLEPPQLSRIPLPAPEAKEAQLFVHAVEARTLLIVRRGDVWTGAELSSQQAVLWLKEHLSGVRRVHFYLDPRREGWDWQTLPMDNKPWGSQAELIFHADLGPPPRAPANEQILILGDPAGALPRARAEAQKLANKFQGQGKDTIWVPEADRAQLAALLTRAPALFHYSGHGVQDGLDGLESGLPLKNGQRFTVTDVLTLTGAPQKVMLAACDLGSRGTHPGAPGLGLTHALLLVGTEQVIAAVRPIEDKTTGPWVEKFYSAPSQSWSEALRWTQNSPEGAQTPFRLWVRD